LSLTTLYGEERVQVVLESKTDKLPSGAMIMWPSQIPPDGYSICNGTGNLDMRNRFPVGAGSNYPIGVNGGSRQIAGHALSIPELPTFHLTIPFGNARNNAGSSTGSPTGLISATRTNTSSIGSGRSHGHGSNNPPYKPLTFLCKN